MTENELMTEKYSGWCGELSDCETIEDEILWISGLGAYVLGWEDSKKEPTWISVEDRLPDIGRYYFVVHHGMRNGIPLDSVIDKCMYDVLFGWDEHYVTHWMPLMPLPKGLK